MPEGQCIVLMMIDQVTSIYHNLNPSSHPPYLARRPFGLIKIKSKQHSKQQSAKSGQMPRQRVICRNCNNKPHECTSHWFTSVAKRVCTFGDKDTRPSCVFWEHPDCNKGRPSTAWDDSAIGMAYKNLKRSVQNNARFETAFQQKKNS